MAMQWRLQCNLNERPIAMLSTFFRHYAYLPVLVAREVASGEPAFRVYEQGVLTVGKQRN